MPAAPKRFAKAKGKRATQVGRSVAILTDWLWSNLAHLDVVPAVLKEPEEEK